jgi:hypothetical protein
VEKVDSDEKWGNDKSWAASYCIRPEILILKFTLEQQHFGNFEFFYVQIAGGGGGGYFRVECSC